ncbi:hypothetical protein [Nocardiopsis tropica]|uniref:Uncharacterized protein n=1 Tax=Nocardiopsis tropica TaxID=109330 RepID=A0ABU7KR90_9ACTN|nr:hypothetical protein [Nocardiopsis umidischolae]MEE2051821.1 hypothetical protein [Nocardiopsis umidischolae]
MSADPIHQALKGVADALARPRLYELEAERDGAEPCDNLISTPWMGRQGLPIFAQCRRATDHDDLHEDEHGRRWHLGGLLVETDENEG